MNQTTFLPAGSASKQIAPLRKQKLRLPWSILTCCALALGAFAARAVDPVIVCPSDMVVTNDAGQCSAVVNFTVTTVLDATLDCVPPSGSTFPLGATAVNCTATDASMNTALCGFIVTVMDNEKPSMSCPAGIAQDNDSGQCSAAVSFTVTATDNCGAIAAVCDPLPGSTFPLGATTVNCTATDASGNSATCSFTVTVRDNEEPSMNCPASFVQDNDPGQCSAAVSFTATAQDNCGALTAVCDPLPGSTFPLGATTVNCTATDASGNSAKCSFTVTVRDNEKPNMNCPLDIVQDNDPGQCSAVVTYAATAQDNCGALTAVCDPLPGSTFALGATTVNCTATDASGNSASCSFTVTVKDNDKPSMNCPTVVVQLNDPGQCSAVVSYTATAQDNCGPLTPVCDPISGSTFPLGPTIVNCTATDASGNSASCTFTVTVLENEKPTMNCPADIVQASDPGQCSAVVTYTATAQDNCGPLTPVCAPPSGSTFPLGPTTVNCTATDASGNSANCSFSVTVGALAPPTVTCPGDIKVDGNCQGGAEVPYFVSASDCAGAIANVECSPSGHTFPVGTTIVICTATGSAGIPGSCTFKVTVSADAVAPQLTCPGDMTVDATGQTTAVATYTTPTATGSCGAATVVCAPPSGSTFHSGATTVRCTATDPATNSTSCSFKVTVNNPPVCALGISCSYTNGGNRYVIALQPWGDCVVLNASASSDVNHDHLDVRWVIDGSNVLAGAVVTNCMSFGCHSIALLVGDGRVVSTCRTNLCVISGSEAVGQCLDLMQNTVILRKNTRPLIVSLKAASAAFDLQRFRSALDQLLAFESKVRAQISRSNPREASAFIAAAQSIVDAVQCSAHVGLNGDDGDRQRSGSQDREGDRDNSGDQGGHSSGGHGED